MTKQQVPASEVRNWARSKGFAVGDRGHLPQHVIEAYNRQHRVKVFVNQNPWLSENKQELVSA